MSPTGYPQGHALLIGVANYRNINSLPAGVLNDATDVASTLMSAQYCGYPETNVTTLLDGQATRSEVLKALADLAARVTEDSTACVFFSGHGGVMQVNGQEESLLATVEIDKTDIPGTSISAGELAAALSNIKAKRLLVFIDACHSGGAAISKQLTDHKGLFLRAGYSQRSFDKLAAGTGRALMAASRLDEYSGVFHGARNSIFTTALLAGLKGGADKGGSGVIKVFDLFSYIADEVKTIAGDGQHPVFKADNLEDNFAVALNQGGLKALRVASVVQAPAPQQSDPWFALEAVLTELYPLGPNDQELWSRAGGDLSRLRLNSSGHASWHAALRTLKQGGGGANISFDSLVSAAKEDFSQNPQLGVF